MTILSPRRLRAILASRMAASVWASWAVTASSELLVLRILFLSAASLLRSASRLRSLCKICGQHVSRQHMALSRERRGAGGPQTIYSAIQVHA